MHHRIARAERSSTSTGNGIAGPAPEGEFRYDARSAFTKERTANDARGF